jgi:hypothetical protein
MANMSYCRFENTYRDLLDCLNAMNDNLSESEAGYRERLVDVCREIIDEYELNKMSEEDDDWDNEPEYDGAGFTYEDRVVYGEYMNTQDNNDEVPWDTQTR